MPEPTGSQRDAASALFNLSDYRVLAALALPDGGRRVEVEATSPPGRSRSTVRLRGALVAAAIDSEPP